MFRGAAYLAGGIAVLLAIDFVAANSGFLGTHAAQAEGTTSGTFTFDRSLKGDRLTVLRPAQSARETVASGDHGILFRTDPANVTVIVKGPAKAVTRPSEPTQQLGRSIREPGRVDPTPVGAPEATPQRKILDGCDPSFSPVAAPSLSHITGRCIARTEGATKFAALRP
jgi:hypothetical protein